MFLSTNMLHDLASQVLGEVLFRVDFLTGHRVPPLAKTVEGTAAFVGNQVIDLEVRRFVFEAAREVQRRPLALTLVDIRAGLIGYNNKVILVAGVGC
jgi:hypothetical protein